MDEEGKAEESEEEEEREQKGQRPLACVSESWDVSWELSGGLLGRLGGVWRVPGVSWNVLEASGSILWIFWVSHGASWEFFGASVALSLLRLNTHTWCASLHL